MKMLGVMVTIGVELGWIGELKEAVGVMEMSSDSFLSDAGTLLMKKIVQKEIELKGGKDGNVVTIGGILLENERFRKREENERSEKEKEKKEKDILMKEKEKLRREMEELRKKSEDERKQFDREQDQMKKQIRKLKQKQSLTTLLRSSFPFCVFYFSF
jgi:regulator of replication initiation timing